MVFCAKDRPANASPKTESVEKGILKDVMAAKFETTVLRRRRRRETLQGKKNVLLKEKGGSFASRLA
jgi:hypothetical protein